MIKFFIALFCAGLASPTWAQTIKISNAKVTSSGTPATTKPLKDWAAEIVAHDAQLAGAVGTSVGAGLVTATGSTTARSLADIAASIGVSAPAPSGGDDRAALQALIDGLEATAHGGAVRLANAHYRISSALTISGTRSVWLIAQGWGHNASGDGGTVIENTGTGNTITIGDTAADRTVDVRLLGVRLQGNASSGHGVAVRRVHNWRIEGCRIWGHGGDGINLDRAYANTIKGNYINNNAGDGIEANELSDFTRIIGNTILANGGNGIYFSNGNASGSKIIWNDIEGNGIGIKANAGTSTSDFETLTIAWNYLEGQVGKNISLAEDGSVTRWVVAPMILNNQVNGSAPALGRAIALDRVMRPTIVGNVFTNSDLTVTSATTPGVLFGNYYNGSVYPMTGWAMWDMSDMSGALLGGPLPGLTYTPSGWTIRHYAGSPYSGDKYEIGINAKSISDTQANLADVASYGYVLRFTPTGIRTYFASPGANPRTLTRDGVIGDVTGAGQDRAGLAVLTGGTATVTTATVTTGSVILLTRQVTGGTTGDLRVGTIVNGVSFVINSASGTDTSTVAWMIVR